MLQLEIVTPEKKTFSDTVDTVVLPGELGEMGLLPSHAPLVTALTPGELSYSKDGKTEVLAVGEGFAEISRDKVSVITDLAISDSEIDESSVEEAMARAQEAIDNKDQSEEDHAAMQAVIAKSMAQLKVKRKRRSI